MQPSGASRETCRTAGRRERRPSRAPGARRARRGGAYALVMGIAFVVAVMAFTVLTVAQLNGRALALSNDAAEAEVLAESAVEYAQSKLAASSTWRTDYANGVETAAVPLGRGSFTFKLVDEVDGSLSNNNDDPVRIYGTGRVGNAVKIYSLSNSPLTPLSCLAVGASAGGNVTLGSTTIAGTVTLTSNGSITATLPVLNGASFEAVTGLNLGTITGLLGGSTYPASPRQMPDPAKAFDYYTRVGTRVSIASFPGSGFTRTIKYRLFSKGTHPLGGTPDPNGIYVIDCQGYTVTLSNCRVVGTLVLLNTTTSSVIQGSNYFAPASANYPSLMAKGDLTISGSTTALADNAATGDANVPSINYNPTGTPYKSVTDSTYTTSFPSEFDGVTYVSGNLAASGSTTFNGVLVVGGSLSTSGTLTLTYDPSAYNAPPPGFLAPQLTPVSGSWRWETQ